MAFDRRFIEEFKEKTDLEKLQMLLETPDDFCNSMLYLVEYHLTTDLRDSMYIKLHELKNRIMDDEDTYVAEQIILILTKLEREDGEELPIEPEVEEPEINESEAIID
jgi:hypothetical protein